MCFVAYILSVATFNVVTRILICMGKNNCSQSKIKLVLGSWRHLMKGGGTLLLRVGHGKYEWISEEGHCDDAKCYAMNNLDFPERVISHNISLRLILLVLNI